MNPIPLNIKGNENTKYEKLKENQMIKEISKKIIVEIMEKVEKLLNFQEWEKIQT